ncbi:hypothetical protein MSAN_00070400 [Mycena sanguinolenta]|uniref:AAA-ATPase-like domain-containing protein n=1 Tax=Mycena sanguinolenta TaxID=230812 RepID=A0A8H7DLB1_9AGAR|nr:hypothetical protein MSAN_00070400 [Mycena sanguinolenta]
MAIDSPVKINIRAYFSDRHPLEAGPHFTCEFDITMLRDTRVADVLRAIQQGHRNAHCGICLKLGPILVKSAWLLRDIPNATTNGSSELDHDPQRGIQFLESASYMHEYLDHSPRELGIIVLCECTFDKTGNSSGQSAATISGKRLRETADDASDDANKKAKLDLPPHQGVCIITPFEDSAAGPLALTPPSLTFSSRIDYPGTVFIDKTRVIPTLNELVKSNPCFVALPPKTGKTALMSMYTTWLDCGIDRSTHRKLFESTSIRRIRFIETQPRSCFCLIFDFHRFLLNNSASNSGSGDSAHDPLSVDVTDSIDRFLSQTIQDFAARYKEKLEIIFSPDKLDCPTDMLTTVLNAVKNPTNKYELFIGLDHWDAPILQSLWFKNDSLTREITTHITQFLSVLTALPDSEGPPVPKILALSNLPPFNLKGYSLRFHNLSVDLRMDGTFGITDTELDKLFTLLSHNRLTKLTITPEERFLLVVPVSPFSRRQPPDAVYNFGLVLNHAAVTLGIGSSQEYLVTPSSNWLDMISQCCEKSLRYSSLRRGRHLVVSTLLNGVDVLAVAESQRNLWALLIHLGALVCSAKEQRSFDDLNSTWTLKIGGSFVKKQLFSRYPPFPKDRESIRDIQLRALLAEHNPTPLAEGIFRLLFRTHLVDLYKMTERVLQKLWDGFMDADHQLIEDGFNDFEEGSEYLDNYFPQLGLLTNSQVPPGDRAVRDAGHGRYGFLDIFICGLQDVRPGCVVAIELKCFSLHGLFRAKCETEQQCYEEVHGTSGSSTFWQKCQDKLTQLAAMSEAEVQQLPYHYYASQGSGPAKDTYSNIGAIVDKGKRQLQSYMNALVKGNALNGREDEGNRTKRKKG